MPSLPDEEVVAIFEDGVKFTMGDFKRVLMVVAPTPENQKRAIEDRASFVRQWAFMRKLAQMAEADKLDQQSPTREMLEYDRTRILMNVALTQALNRTSVDPPEIATYYNEHKENYKQVHLRAIYIAFGTTLTEEQARAKAEKLLTAIRAGADFIQLVKENSDDEISRGKDGDFLTLRRGDNVPDAMRAAVFQLKAGEVSDVVRQPNGFYIFRADDVTFRTISQVEDEIFTALKEIHYREWLEKANGSVKVQFPSPVFTGLGLPPAELK